MSSLMIILRHSIFLHSCQGHFKRWPCPWVLVLVLVTRFVWKSDLQKKLNVRSMQQLSWKMMVHGVFTGKGSKTQNIVDIQCNARWYEVLETWKLNTLPTSSAAVLRHLVTALRLISYWKHWEYGGNQVKFIEVVTVNYKIKIIKYCVPQCQYLLLKALS